MARKPGVAQLVNEHGLTPSSLAERSGLSKGTAYRAVRPDNTAQLNMRSATKIAEALGTEVDEINWPGGGLSNRGRPGGSGSK